MGENIPRYNFYGEDCCNESMVLQVGMLVYCSGGRVVVILEEEGSCEESVKRIIIGRHNPIKNRLDLLKIASQQTRLSTIIYSLDGNGGNNFELSSDYQGAYAQVRDMDVTKEIGFLFGVDALNLESLVEIDMELFERLIPITVVAERIRKNNQKRENISRMRFERISI